MIPWTTGFAFGQSPFFCVIVVQIACILLLGSEDVYGVLGLEDFIMTQEQKTRITQLRQQNTGYASIARELGLSVNTVKAFCRRNDLSGTRDQGVQPIQTLSGDAPQTDLHSGESRGNSTTHSRPGSLENPEHPDIKPVWNVSVSYADTPDENAVADVLSMLMNASYGR